MSVWGGHRLRTVKEMVLVGTALTFILPSARYTCPFVEKFSIEIETYYLPDGGQQPNVFNLSGAERRQRILGEVF